MSAIRFYLQWVWCMTLCISRGKWPTRVMWRWPANRCDETDMARARESLNRPDVLAELERLQAQGGLGKPSSGTSARLAPPLGDKP